MKNVKKKKPVKITKPMEYKLKTSSIEKVLIVIVAVLFGLTLMFDQNKPLLIMFYAVATAILLYYFVLYRNRPPYVRINIDSVTVHTGLLFKPHDVPLSAIKTVLNENGKIMIFAKKYDPIVIRTMLLEEADAETIEKVLGSYAD